MPIRLGDLDDDDAELQLRCRQCGKRVTYPGKYLVRRFGAWMTVTALVARMRCTKDRMVPEVRIVLRSIDASTRGSAAGHQRPPARVGLKPAARQTALPMCVMEE